MLYDEYSDVLYFCAHEFITKPLAVFEIGESPLSSSELVGISASLLLYVLVGSGLWETEMMP